MPPKKKAEAEQEAVENELNALNVTLLQLSSKLKYLANNSADIQQRLPNTLYKFASKAVIKEKEKEKSEKPKAKAKSKSTKAAEEVKEDAEAEQQRLVMEAFKKRVAAPDVFPIADGKMIGAKGTDTYKLVVYWFEDRMREQAEWNEANPLNTTNVDWKGHLRALEVGAFPERVKQKIEQEGYKFREQAVKVAKQSFNKIDTPLVLLDVYGPTDDKGVLKLTNTQAKFVKELLDQLYGIIYANDVKTAERNSPAWFAKLLEIAVRSMDSSCALTAETEINKLNQLRLNVAYNNEKLQFEETIAEQKLQQLLPENFRERFISKEQFARQFNKTNPPIPSQYACLIVLYNWLYRISEDVRAFVQRKPSDARPAALRSLQQKITNFLKAEGVPAEDMIAELTDDVVAKAFQKKAVAKKVKKSKSPAAKKAAGGPVDIAAELRERARKRIEIEQKKVKAERGRQLRKLMTGLDLSSHCKLSTVAFVSRVVATLGRLAAASSEGTAYKLNAYKDRIEGLLPSRSLSKSASGGFADVQNLDDLILVVMNQKYCAAVGESEDVDMESMMQRVLDVLEGPSPPPPRRSPAAATGAGLVKQRMAEAAGLNALLARRAPEPGAGLVKQRMAEASGLNALLARRAPPPTDAEPEVGLVKKRMAEAAGLNALLARRAPPPPS